MQGLLEEPKVVVGLDFGTSFSGFAFARRASPEEIYTFYDWPKQSEGGGIPYCKTQTSLLYASSAAEETGEQTLELRDWGWPAFVEYKSTVVVETGDDPVDEATPDLDFEVVHDFEIDAASPKMPTPAGPGHSGASNAGSHFLSHFKLHLASNDAALTAPALPRGLTAKRAIADFLSRIAKLVLQEVRNKFGPHISQDDVQWCLTVPAIWDAKASQEMQDCAEMGGLVQGSLCNDDIGSPHRLKLFMEPEAASVYCQGFTDNHLLRKGSKFLVVDCGGGTVDLVLHEKLGDAPTLSVKEVQESSGDICGGSRVDEEFFKFLRRKICCFERFESEHPAVALPFLKSWETIKYRFDGENGDETVELPPTLAEMWETEEGISSSSSYDELSLTNGDMKSMFDPIIKQVLELIEEKMVPDLTAIMVVGGFSESPYLRKRIRDTFGSRVSSIHSPPYPGSAVCQGAVTLGIQSDIVVSRISKKTYGVRVSRPFIAGVHDEFFKVEGDAGKFYCNNIFGAFVRKGDEVRFDDCVQNVYFPMCEEQDELEIVLYSSSSRNVKFISDVGSVKEGTFTVKIPTQNELGFMPKVEVSMHFGRCEIQVTAVGKNFTGEKKGMLPVRFEASGIY